MLSRERSMPLMGCSVMLTMIIVYHYKLVRMIVQNEEKKMLIESMKKLTSHVAGNGLRQKDIFEALSLHDFNKIITNLKDENEYLRRISALFLCQLFYGNPQTKRGAVALLGIQPAWGRVCLGGIPEMAGKYPSALKKSVELMRGPVQQQQQHKMCWVINLKRKNPKLELLDYKKYSSFTFVDPSKHIFGYTINPDPKQQERTPAKTQAGNRQPPPLVQRVEERILNSSMDHYKNLLDQRQKSKERVIPMKYSLIMNSDLQSDRRNSTSSTGSTSYRNQLGASQHAKKQETIQNIGIRPTTGTTAQNKYENNSRYYKPSLHISPKVSYTEVMERNSHKHSSHYQQTSVDRSPNGRRSDNRVNPASTRESGSRGQEKFYKRVKDIIRK